MATWAVGIGGLEVRQDDLLDSGSQAREFDLEVEVGSTEDEVFELGRLHRRHRLGLLVLGRRLLAGLVRLWLVGVFARRDWLGRWQQLPLQPDIAHHQAGCQNHKQ
jgi:hypothetical protein